jgi:dipeptidyl aminopeptidase/acylaminoacyl peptidase
LVIRDVKTGVDRLLTSGSGEEDSPISSPDGLLLSFLSNRDGRWGLYVAPVDQAPVANPIRMATLEKRPDARGITFRHWFDNGRIVNGFYYQDRGLYRFDLDPATARVKGAPVSLNTDTSERTFPAVSPDGRQIASWSRDGVKTGIAISDRDGAGARLVLEHALRPSAGVQPGGTGVPLVWRSPDEIVFYEWSPRPGETEGFRILTISRGAVTPLPHGENQPFVWEFSRGTYVPSRNALVFRTGGNVGRSESIKVRILDAGSERTLTTATSLGPVAVSADGRSIAYSHFAYTDPVRGMVPAEIRVVSFDGTSDRVLATASGDIRDSSRRRFLVESWTPNGRHLLFRNESGQLRMMDVMSGTSTAFFDQAGTVWNEGAWAPDGSFLVRGGYSERAHWSNFEGVSYDAVMRLMSRPGLR